MRKFIPKGLSSGEVSLSISKERSVFIKSSLCVGLDLKSSGSGGAQLSKSLSGGCYGSSVGVESRLLLAQLGLIVIEGGLPSSEVDWERGTVSGSRASDLVSELSDEVDDLLDGGTITGLGEHGEGVDEWEIGRVLSESPEFLSNFF